jgi:hypothetical protein
MSLLETRYEPLLETTRGRLDTDPVLATLSNRKIGRTKLLRFLIEYSARSVRMTEPVDSWIRRAGEATNAVGLTKIGDDLVKHAHHEEGHHLMLIEDTRRLVAHWNEMFPTQRLDADALIEQDPLPATTDYIDLHEDVIASDKPYGQVAIELEIEGLAISWAPSFVTNVKEVLGDAVCGELSFLHEHIQLDIGHTAYNKRLMNALLTVRDEDVEAIAAVGRRALDTYIDYLGQVWAMVDGEASMPLVAGGPTEEVRVAVQPTLD